MNPLVNAIQNGNPAEALASLYSTLEFRSNFTPPIVASTRDILTPNGQPGSNWLMDWLKPTVLLRGGAGNIIVAPNGPAGDGTLGFVAIVGGIALVGFVLGRWSK